MIKSELKNITLRFNNARIVIRQIKNDEWVPEWSEHSNEHLTALRGKYKMWIGNGAFFCEVIPRNEYDTPGALGLIWRHWVWWAAARKLKKNADRERKSAHKIPKL
ncbi:hypothetical protein P88_00330 [Erwinia phage phiEt88]|uniref:hypothetical protein n=1 Tax=Erwinia phage phiEt88 TaxID=925984 RepID=UPI0001F1FC71|nr:hypothetical protein ErPhphiEt88_gp33 [Erwinia phage phiEt88]CBX44544.1 hypothetical protein P88_00330 [Erwinia phage phiEt88]